MARDFTRFAYIDACKQVAQQYGRILSWEMDAGTAQKLADEAFANARMELAEIPKVSTGQRGNTIMGIPVDVVAHTGICYIRVHVEWKANFPEERVPPTTVRFTWPVPAKWWD